MRAILRAPSLIFIHSSYASGGRFGLVQVWGKAIDRGEPMVDAGEMAELRG